MRRVYRYLTMTVFSAIVLYGGTIGLREVIGLPAELAYGIAMCTVVVMNFVLLRMHVFEAREGCPKRQLSLYLLSVVGFRTSEYLAFLVLHTWLNLWYVAAMLIISGFGTVAKFFVYGKIFATKSQAGLAEVIEAAENPETA